MKSMPDSQYEDEAPFYLDNIGISSQPACSEVPSWMDETSGRGAITKESNLLFAFIRVMGLFIRSKASGLVFSLIYPRWSFAPSAFPPAQTEREGCGFPHG
jgi:hypothetical protein